MTLYMNNLQLFSQNISQNYTTSCFSLNSHAFVCICNCPRLALSCLICFPVLFFLWRLSLFFSLRTPFRECMWEQNKMWRKRFYGSETKKTHENKVKHGQINCKTIKRTHWNCTCDDGRVWRLRVVKSIFVGNFPTAFCLRRLRSAKYVGGSDRG